MHPSRMDVAIMEENAMCDLGSFVHCPGPRHSISTDCYYRSDGGCPLYSTQLGYLFT
jgi:hypothetical protein